MAWPWSDNKKKVRNTIDKLEALSLVTDYCDIDKSNIRQSEFELYPVSEVLKVMIKSGLYKRDYDLQNWNCKHVAKSMLHFLIKARIRDCGLVIGINDEGIAHEVNWIFTADKQVAFLDGRTCSQITLTDVSAIEM